MATIRIPTPLRKLTQGKEEVTARAAPIGALIASLETQYPGIKERICDDSGQVRRFVNIFANDEDIRFLKNLDTPVKDSDEVSIVPAIAGGCVSLLPMDQCRGASLRAARSRCPRSAPMARSAFCARASRRRRRSRGRDRGALPRGGAGVGTRERRCATCRRDGAGLAGAPRPASTLGRALRLRRRRARWRGGAARDARRGRARERRRARHGLVPRSTAPAPDAAARRLDPGA